ncbi:MAG: hypothetical protein GTN99_03075 [Candidatus Dadabacteria bacterium]|nr:hypothetical protein [Candidatus Dadabacteria bacterium]
MVLDEGDFRQSDEKSEIAKVLNNGNAQGFPILRSEIVPGKEREYSPKAYSVFGPKIVATRGYFDDRALETRCITEEMGQRDLREDIPINLSDEHKVKARKLRNKLLMFRFRNLGKREIVPSLVDRTIEPRLNQVFIPLLSVIDDIKAREELKTIAQEYHKQIIAERGMETEAQVLEVIKTAWARKEEPSVMDLTRIFIEKHGEDFDRRITAKWVGNVIRKNLKIKTERRKNRFVIPRQEKVKLERLYKKYGIIDDEPSEDISADDLPF